MKKRVIVLGLATLVISACAIQRTETDFRAVTSTQVGVPAQNVKILSSTGGKYNPFVASFTGKVEGFNWMADTPKGIYSCEGDVNLKRVVCTPKEAEEKQPESQPPAQQKGLTSGKNEHEQPILLIKPTPALIAEIQTLLQEAGYKPVPADGKIGKKTIDALRKFQQENGISPTGKIDQETIEKLRASRSTTKTLTKNPQAK